MSKGNQDREPGRPTQEAIARRAYELFLQRGSVAGYELDDWLQAEAELTAAASAAALDGGGTAHDGERGVSRPASGGGTSSEPSGPSDDGRRPATRERTPNRRVMRS